MRTTIDKAGRLVIPKEIRDEAGLGPGVELDIDYRDGQVLIEPVSKVELVKRGWLLTSRVPGAPKMSQELSNRLIRRSRERKL